MRQIALGIVVTGLISTSAWAQEPTVARLVTDRALAGVSFTTPAPTAQDPAEPESPFTVTVGVDVPSDYVWRGFLQENSGFIAQPYVDFGVALSETVSFNAGIWTSMHSAESTGTFYEADYYAGLNFAAGKWAPSVMYTAYTSPNDTFGVAHELAFSVGYDSPLAPSATLALFDLSDPQMYLEVGVEPSAPTQGAVSVSFPVAVGLSLRNFYGEFDFDEEDEEEIFESRMFGYFKAGVAVGADLGGGWEVHGGVDVLFLGNSVRWDDKSVKPVFTVGFSYSR